MNFFNFQEEGKRMREESGEIATTAKIRRTQRVEGRGRGKGSERGRETQVNVTTLTTRTKQSTGIAEAMKLNQCLLMTALYSSALTPPHVSSSKTCPSSPTVCPPLPLSAGVLLLPVWFENTVCAQMGWGTFSHKAWPTTDFKKSSFLSHSLYSFASSTERAPLLKCSGDIDETAVRPEEQTEKWLCGGLSGRRTCRQRHYTMCLLIRLFNGALVQHCVSCLNVDFATLCRTVVYYCCSCSLDLFILFGAEFVRKK